MVGREGEYKEKALEELNYGDHSDHILVALVYAILALVETQEGRL